MMTCAYDKDMMLLARDNLAVMIDYAVTWCGIGLREFYDRFLSSGIADAFADGHPKYTLGMSGIELAVNVMESTGGSLPADQAYFFPWNDSSYFWTGWALCQYQWYKSCSFASIQKNGLPIERIHSLYNPLHEANITKVFQVFDSWYHPRPISIRERRKLNGLTQQQLSGKSGVSLRMVRAYEQGRQDIGKAEASSVIGLARALHCEPWELI